MSTKPDTDTGWTDQFPHKLGVGDGYHFVRRKDGKDVVIMGFSMGKAWLNGVSYEPSELRSHLFLGPLTPSDFEQLIRLRAQPSISDAIKEVCTWTKYKESDEFGFDHYSTTCGRDTGNSGEFAPAWTHCPYCGKTLKVENG